MKRISLKTEGMHCPSCSMLVEMAVSDLPGVLTVNASVPESRTEVSFDPDLTSVEVIEDAIREAGYEVGPVVTVPAGR